MKFEHQRRSRQVPWYYRVRNAINTAAPFLVPTQKTNLALLLSAVFKKRTLYLSELARLSHPQRATRHRLQILLAASPQEARRFTDNGRVDALTVQLAFVAHTVARLGHPRRLGVAADWIMFKTVVPSGEQ